MDKVRFGRALGYGVRHATKTLLQAAEAAAAPDPNAKPSAPASTSVPRSNLAEATRSLADAHRAVEAARAEARTRGTAAVKQAGRGFFAPLKTFSRVLWLQVTGVFFGLLTAAMAEGLWMRRAAFRDLKSHDALQVYALIALFLLFGYFTISSFYRARRLERATSR